MKYLNTYKLFESTSELLEFINYLKYDLEDDGFTIRQSNSYGSDSFDFMRYKWKNISPSHSNWQAKKNELNFYKGKEVKVFEIVTNLNNKYGLVFSTGLNLYDVEPHVKRLLDYSKSLGYNHFEIRKITQMSRKSQDVTKSFMGKGRLPESAKREIHILQILIAKPGS